MEHIDFSVLSSAKADGSRESPTLPRDSLTCHTLPAVSTLRAVDPPNNHVANRKLLGVAVKVTLVEI